MRHKAGIAVAWGLSKQAALNALTSNLYKILGLSKNYGTLRRNRIANMVLWSGDPLELKTQAVQVWIKGRKIPMISRQILLRERYRTFGNP